MAANPLENSTIINLENTTNSLRLTDTKSTKKITRHREDRINIPNDIKTECTLTFASGETCIASLCDLSSFGVRIKIKKQNHILPENEVLHLKVYITNTLIFDNKAVIVNELTSDEVSYLGLSLVEGLIDKDQVRAAIANEERIPVLSRSKNLATLMSQVRPEFKILMADLMTCFADIKNTLEAEEELIKKQALNENHLKRLEQQLIDLATSIYGRELQSIFDKFQVIVDSFNKDEEILHKQYFRINFLRSLVEETPFMKRAFEKPLGYAGDFGLMVMFYEYEDKGRNLFYKFMHRAACNQPAAVANKNRVYLLADIMENFYVTNKKENKKHIKITSIACGPAKESELFLQQMNSEKTDTVELVLIDQEPLALDCAINACKKAGNSKAKLKVQAFQEDVIMGIIRKKPFVKEIEESDLVISAGLFDYLSDRAATKFIDTLFEFVKPGGELIIGNVSSENPDRFSMNYFMEWNLILRSPDQLKSLVSDSLIQKYNPTVTVIAESLGLNLFLRVKKIER